MPNADYGEFEQKCFDELQELEQLSVQRERTEVAKELVAEILRKLKEELKPGESLEDFIDRL